MNGRRIAAAALAMAAAACGASPAADVRPCTGAGFWYPAGKDDLARTVDDFLREKPDEPVSGRPVGVISPHAGYRFSGRASGAAFGTLRGQPYRRVIVLGFSHGRFVQGASILRVTAYNTPLGDVPVDTDVTAALLANELFTTQGPAHRNEHSLENQLPFLQRALPEGWKLVPIFIGQADAGEDEISAASMKLYADLADAIRPHVDDQTLVVASSDWTHYGENYSFYPFGRRAFAPADIKARLKEFDDGAIEPIRKLDLDGFREYVNAKKATICGRRPICVLLRLMPQQAKAHVASHYTSGDLTGDWRSSVGYVSLVFAAPGGATKADANVPDPDEEIVSKDGEKKLLQIARSTLEAVLSGKPAPALKVDAAELQGNNGVFVTLKKGDDLRGCIGCFTAQQPLHKTVGEYAVISATRDSRFPPVRASELKDITIEISVLSPMRRVHDPIRDVVLGKHGIYIRRGGRTGTYLPQVATEHKMSKEEFLSSCCAHKAGLPGDAWKDPRTEVYVYTAQVFHEE